MGQRKAIEEKCEGCPLAEQGWVCGDHKMIVAIQGNRWAALITMALFILAGVGGTYWRVSGIAGDVATVVAKNEATERRVNDRVNTLERRHEALERRVNDHHERAPK